MDFKVKIFLVEELVEAADLTICNPSVDRIVNDIAGRCEPAQAAENEIRQDSA